MPFNNNRQAASGSAGTQGEHGASSSTSSGSLDPFQVYGHAPAPANADPVVLEMRARNIIEVTAQQYAGAMIESADDTPFTAAELWEIISEHNIASIPARFAQTTRAISTYQHKQGDSVGTTFDRMYQLRIQMRDSNHPIGDHDFVAFLINALPTQFKELRGPLNAVKPSRTSHKEQRGILVTAELELGQGSYELTDRSQDQAQSAVFHVAKRSRQANEGPGNAGASPIARCLNCGSFGTHTAANCLAPRRNPSEWPSQPSNYLLRRIGKQGLLGKNTKFSHISSVVDTIEFQSDMSYQT